MEDKKLPIRILVSSLCIASICAHATRIEDALDPALRYKDVFTAALILTEGDVISVGFNNFDPNKIFGTNNGELGGADSLDTAKKISSTSLPTTFYLGDTDGDWLNRVKLRAAWLTLSNEFDYSNTPSPEISAWETDYVEDTVIAGYAEYSLGYKITERWNVFFGNGFHIMHYENNVEENSPFLGLVQDQGIENFFNTDTNAWIVEPQLDFEYNYDFPLALWQFKSEYHYVYGQSFGGSGAAYEMETEGWRVSNSVQLKHHLPNLGTYEQDILLRFRRIDVGGDLRDPLDATHYNEYSVGWLIDTSRFSSLIYNMGIGLNINYGSSLKGGSIVFFYNE